MAADIRQLEQEREEKKNTDLEPEERDSLERDEDVSEDLDEHWHTGKGKVSANAAEDWAYIDDGFDAELAELFKDQSNKSDHLTDIVNALATWRITLSDNNVLDDLLNSSQDVPTATAYGDLMRLIDEYDEGERGWLPEQQYIRQSLKHLKGAATRFNETMMKTAAEVHSDMDEQTTYLDLKDIAADPVGYKLKRAIKRQNKRIFERLNTYDDTIRGEKDMSRVIAAFIPEGQGDGWTTEERAKCDAFIEDYASQDALRRKPHLERITNQMLDLAVSLEMYTQDYLKDNVDKMAFFLTQLSYFEDVRNDPVNADFFWRLPEKTQKKLDVINRIGTSFTPGDFIKNVNAALTRPDAYKLDGADEVRLSGVMRKGGVDQVATEQMYDTKVAIESYKRDRR